MYERTDKMFVITLKSKIKKPKRMLILLVFAVFLSISIFYVINNSQNTSAYCPGVGEYSLKFGTDGEKEDFFSAFNLQCNLVTIDKVRIPETFNSTYESYNKLQKEIGLNLDDYKGKTVKRFVYKTDDNKYLSVLCYKRKVVGCHICTNIYGDDFQSLVS